MDDPWNGTQHMNVEQIPTRRESAFYSTQAAHAGAAAAERERQRCRGRGRVSGGASGGSGRASRTSPTRANQTCCHHPRNAPASPRSRRAARLQHTASTRSVAALSPKCPEETGGRQRRGGGGEATDSPSAQRDGCRRRATAEAATVAPSRDRRQARRTHSPHPRDPPCRAAERGRGQYGHRLTKRTAGRRVVQPQRQPQ